MPDNSNQIDTISLTRNPHAFIDILILTIEYCSPQGYRGTTGLLDASTGPSAARINLDILKGLQDGGGWSLLGHKQNPMSCKLKYAFRIHRVLQCLGPATSTLTDPLVIPNCQH